MRNKSNNYDPLNNLEYEKILEEERFNSKETQTNSEKEWKTKNKKLSRLKRTTIEIVNRLFYAYLIVVYQYHKRYVMLQDYKNL